jgi:hypothetical protein
MTREEILAAIRECAAKLKRVPTVPDLKRMKQINRWDIKLRFGTLAAALAEVGMVARGRGHRHDPEFLLLDWARVARKLKQLPSMAFYRAHGRCAPQPFYLSFGSWHEVPGRFARMAREKGIRSKWKDVLAMIAKRHASESPSVKAMQRIDHSKHRRDRPVYGPPLNCPGVAHEPVNEAGVVYLFGALSKQLGFIMLRMQTGFPDCEAMREVGSGHWQRVRIEFEFASRNFRQHGHYKNECDMIVCWIHDWPDCPKQLEVLELRKVVVQG